MIKSFITAIAVASLGVIGTTTNAFADNMSCYGSSNYQSCTYSTWVDGEYVTCYGTITPYSKNWNCY